MNELNLRNGNKYGSETGWTESKWKKKKKKKKKAVCPKKEDRPPFHQKPATVCHQTKPYATQICFRNVW